ncbi:MAG: ATP-binding protein [Spirochaetales bacterium]|nr:ATP-binding protein [Spirochaetales bacterium]
MLKRLYIHNYKCLVNFEFKMDDDEYYKHSVLSIGKNGAGKTSVAEILQIFQRIGRGQANLLPLHEDNVEISPVISKDSFSFGNDKVPLHLEIEAEISGHIYLYKVIFELLPGFSYLRVKEEILCIDGSQQFEREVADIHFSQRQQAPFNFDWHSIYLPAFQAREKEENNLVGKFKHWLKRMLIISPVPRSMNAALRCRAAHLQPDCSNITDWYADLLERNPDAYGDVKSNYLKIVFPDFDGLRFEQNEFGMRYLKAYFTQEDRKTAVRFDKLADGEKCVILAALVIAANQADHDSILCFWDEPDNFLALSEIEHFISILKKRFLQKGQIIMTTHSPETVVRFSEDNTYIFFRNDHVSPTRVKTVSQWRKGANFEGNFITAWRLGDVEI